MMEAYPAGYWTKRLDRFKAQLREERQAGVDPMFKTPPQKSPAKKEPPPKEEAPAYVPPLAVDRTPPPVKTRRARTRGGFEETEPTRLPAGVEKRERVDVKGGTHEARALARGPYFVTADVSADPMLKLRLETFCVYWNRDR